MKAIAVALVAVAVAIALAVPVLRNQIEVRLHDDTVAIINEAGDALLEYVAQHGYFPCPADTDSGGLEPEGTNHTTGACPTWYGFLPA